MFKFDYFNSNVIVELLFFTRDYIDGLGLNVS